MIPQIELYLASPFFIFFVDMSKFPVCASVAVDDAYYAGCAVVTRRRLEMRIEAVLLSGMLLPANADFEKNACAL